MATSSTAHDVEAIPVIERPQEPALQDDDDEALREFRLQQSAARTCKHDSGDTEPNQGNSSCSSSGSISSSSSSSDSSDGASAESKTALPDDEIVEVLDVDEETGIFLANPGKFADDAFGSLFGSDSFGEAGSERAEEPAKKPRKKAKKAVGEPSEDDRARTAFLQGTRAKVLKQLLESRKRQRELAEVD